MNNSAERFEAGELRSSSLKAVHPHGQRNHTRY